VINSNTSVTLFGFQNSTQMSSFFSLKTPSISLKGDFERKKLKDNNTQMA
jgi:hypothetical protein